MKYKYECVVFLHKQIFILVYSLLMSWCSWRRERVRSCCPRPRDPGSGELRWWSRCCLVPLPRNCAAWKIKLALLKNQKNPVPIQGIQCRVECRILYWSITLVFTINFMHFSSSFCTARGKQKYEKKRRFPISSFCYNFNVDRILFWEYEWQ